MKWRHWINVHGYRNYQAGEVRMIVDAYNTGVTFSREDMQRIINTNMKVMYNADQSRPGPKWLNSNYEVRRAAFGKPILGKPQGRFKGLAGCLWAPLAQFDAKTAGLAGRTGTPSFKRKHEGLPVTVLEHPFHSSRYFTMVAVMPSVVRKGKASLVASKARVPGQIEIALYSRDGKTKVTDIFKGETEGGQDGHAGILIREWDGSGAEPGEYRVRWRLADDYREFPVTVK